MTRNKFVKGALVAALALPLLMTSACGSRASLDQNTGFARSLDSELYLRADGQKELRREVQYWAGSRNLKQVTVFFSAGGKQISIYRADGTVRLLTEWYPDSSLTVAQPAAPPTTSPVFSGAGAVISPGIQTSPSVSATPTANTSSGIAAPSAVSAPVTTSPSVTSVIANPAVATPGSPLATATSAPTAGSNAVGNSSTANSAATAGATVPAPALESAQSADEALGTAGSTKVYDPPSKFGRVKRSVEYNSDGSVLRASFFRENGSMSAYGRAIAGGDFELVDYLKDGRSIARQQQFTKSGEVFYMRVVAGPPSNTIAIKVDNVERTTTFGDNGMRITRSSKPAYGTEEIEFFKTDGKSLKYIVYRAYKIEALYFKSDGTIDSFRSFDSDGSVSVIKYRDNSGRVKPESVDGATPSEAYRQYWQAKKDAKGNVTYELTRLEEIGKNGRIARRLSFKESKLSQVEYLNEQGQYLKVLTMRDDQTVEKVVTYTYPVGGGEATVISNDIQSGSQMRESYDGKLLRQEPFEDVRPLVPAPSTPQWYYYDGMHF